MLDRATILSHKTHPVATVDVAEWGGTVYVRTLTAKEFDDFQNSNWVEVGKERKFCAKNYRARFVCMVASDESGKRIFTDLDADEVGALSGPAVDKVYEAGQKLNGLDSKSSEQAEKNSETGLNAGSPSV